MTGKMTGMKTTMTGTFELLPVKWQRRSSGHYCAYTIFGKLVVTTDHYNADSKWLFEVYGQDGIQESIPVPSLKVGMKTAEKWYFDQLKPALRAA